MAEYLFWSAMLIWAFFSGASYGFREGKSAGRQEPRVIDLSGSQLSSLEVGTNGP